jgi:hypothetical protein
MTPVPRAASLAEWNQMLANADEVDEHRRIAARVETVGQAAAREVPLLNPLPGNAFRAAALSCRVDAKAMICVQQSYYSVPAQLGRPPGGKVALGADWIDVRHDGVLVARHTRSLHKGSENLVLDHYLEVLVHRPGALAGATALVSARADRRVHRWAPTVSGTPHARKAGDRDGTKALIGVLLLHRTLPTEAVLAGIDAAVGGAPSSSGPGSSERVWGKTLAQVSLHPRQFRVTGHAPRAACPSRSVDEHPPG